MATDSAQLSRLRDTPCAVCGDWESDEDIEGDDPDPVVSCVDCGLVVHAQCYGYGYIDVPAKARKTSKTSQTNEEDKTERLQYAIQHRLAFRCQLCRDGATKPVCVLCGCHGSNRSMKKLTTRGAKPTAEYAHIACVLWTPGPRFADSEQKDGVIDVGKIETARYRLRCIVCESQGRRSEGAPLQCSHKSCRIAYHILCNMEQGWDHSMEPTETGLAVRTYCGKHSTPVTIAAEELDDVACEICAGIDRPSSMILCDSCSHGFHMDCLDPPLSEIPEDKWFCRLCSSKTKAELPRMSKKRKRMQTFFGTSRQVLLADHLPLPSNAPKINTGISSFSETARQKLDIRRSGNVTESAYIFSELISNDEDIVAELTSDLDAADVSVLIVTNPILLRDFGHEDGKKYMLVCSTSEQVIEYREILGGRPFLLVDANEFSCETNIKIDRKQKGRGTEVEGNALNWVIASFTLRIRQILSLFLWSTTDQDMKIADLKDTAFTEMIVRTEQEWKNHMAELTDHKIFEVQGDRVLLLKSRSVVQDALNANVS